MPFAAALDQLHRFHFELPRVRFLLFGHLVLPCLLDEELGSYFKLEDDVLLQCPMNMDSTRDDSPCEVDWYRIDDDLARNLKEVVKELEEKE